MIIKNTPPDSEQELMARCQRLVGLSIAQLAAMCAMKIPQDPLQAKGFLGAVLEKALVTSAKNAPRPDFVSLGIELKTLPIDSQHRPSESTFVTSIPLLSIHRQVWELSTCYLKLRRVLWVPIESDTHIPLGHRRVGPAFLWSPHPEDLEILRQDWLLLTSMIALGELEHIDARIGTYLQIRPKAAHAKILCDAFGMHGEKIKTLPRGFYLRRNFTIKVWCECMKKLTLPN